MSWAGCDKATAAPEAAAISVPGMGSGAALLIDTAILVLLLYRQLTVRPLNDGRFSVVLIGVGLVELVAYGQHHRLTDGILAFLAASLAISVLLGAVRAVTVRLWRQDGRVLRQGTWLTALLWLVSIGSHLAIGAVQQGSTAAATGAATLAFLGVTLGAQQVVLRARAGALQAA
jgi:hypothetical protein